MNGDRVRQVGVTLSGVVCVYGTLVGVGVIGERVEESAGGRLAADATLIAPASPAFSVWSVVYLGLFAYVVWQWLPAQTSSRRLRRTGWLSAASMLLNAAWLLVTQQGWIAFSVVVMLALLTCLGVLARRLHDDPPADVVERVLVDGTFGLYLGWVCVATCANIAAALVDAGVPATGPAATVATLVVLAVVVGVAVHLSGRLPRQYAVAAGIVWGLAWVSIGRFADSPRSPAVAVGAALAAAAVTVAFVVRRGGSGSAAGRRAATAA
jgi:hypothetical protein